MLSAVILTVVLAAFVVFVLLFGMRLIRMSDGAAKRAGTIIGAVGLLMLAVGLYLGLVWAPTAEIMGDSYRIMYIHFPSWVGTAAGYLTAFVASVLYIRTRNHAYDYVASAGAEVGLLFNVIGLITGMLWGRPAWGVYWTWDPRLTTTAIMAITFAGYLVLRAFLEDPEARARVSSLVAIIGFVNVPIVYFSVRWWRTLHQVQSSPDTIDPPMVLTLRVMMVAFVLVFLFMLTQRFRLARIRGEEELEAVRLEVTGD
jgi:heme exporter protein C